MNSRLPPDGAGGSYPTPTESSGIFVGERVLPPPPAEQTIEEEAPVVFSKTLRLWLTDMPAAVVTPAAAVAPVAAAVAAPAPVSSPRTKAQAEDAAFSDAIMAWMRQGDRLSDFARPAEPVDPLAGLDANDVLPVKRRPTETPAQVRARRVRQSLVVMAAAAGIAVAIAWSSRPHIVQANDGASYAATAAGKSASSASASVRAVRADAPGAWLAAPQTAPVAAPSTSGAVAPGPAAVMAVEIPDAAKPAAAPAHARHKQAVSKRRGRARH